MYPLCNINLEQINVMIFVKDALITYKGAYNVGWDEGERAVRPTHIGLRDAVLLPGRHACIIWRDKVFNVCFDDIGTVSLVGDSVLTFTKISYELSIWVS